MSGKINLFFEIITVFIAIAIGVLLGLSFTADFYQYDVSKVTFQEAFRGMTSDGSSYWISWSGDTFEPMRNLYLRVQVGLIVSFVFQVLYILIGSIVVLNQFLPLK